MNYKIVLDGIDYLIKDGFIIKDELNETLDSGVVVFETNQTLNIDSFDSVLIKGDTISTKHQLIDNFIDNQTQFEPSERHEYTLNLFSETKALERITLPSLSITKSKIEGQVKSVYDYIERYCATYLPKIKILVDGAWQYAPKYKLDNALKTRFTMECPEFSWNDPTLKEVLDDLLMVDDCISIVKDNVITFFDLTQRGNQIDMSKINLKQTSKASADYISDLTITMKNSIGENVVNNVEYISLRSDGGEITTENAVLITQHPIYNLKKVVACYAQPYTSAASGSLVGYAYVEVDITRLIVEKDEFDTLKADDIVVGTFPTVDEARKYQKFTLYYTRGNNKIENFGTVKFYASTYAQVLTICANDDAAIRQRFTSEGGFITSSASFFPDLRNIVFKVEYETLDDRKMFVGKYLPIKNENNAIFDNQTSSYVDVKNQSIFEYAKANRLGNLISMIYGVYYNENDLPQLGDYDGDDILFSREISYYDNYILFKGTMTKNYVLKNYFTGIQSKRRSWQIAKDSDALTRYDVKKIYCEFSTSLKTDNLSIFDTEYNTQNKAFLKYLLSPINGETLQQLKCALVFTNSDSTRFPALADGYAFQVDFSAEIQGMSICLNFGFIDNYSVGNYAFKDGSLYRNGIYPYCDSNGEFSSMRLRFLTSIDPTDGRFTLPNFLDKVDVDIMNDISEMGMRKPLILLNNKSTTALGLFLNNYYKDNREIIKNTIQFEFCADTKNIIITKRFLELQQVVKHISSNTYKVYYSGGEVYDLNSTKPLGNIGGSILILYTDFSAKITFTKTGPGIAASWGITDENDNLLIGVNLATTIYLNLLESRDTNVYNNVIDRNVVGKMYDDFSEIQNMPTAITQIKTPQRVIDVVDLISPKFKS